MFLVAIEMSAWITQEEEEAEVKQIVLHQQDLKSSNVTVILSCLMAFQHRNVFMGGSIEALPYV